MIVLGLRISDKYLAAIIVIWCQNVTQPLLLFDLVEKGFLSKLQIFHHTDVHLGCVGTGLTWAHHR